MPSKKRRREERPTIHLKNKYANKPPDFALLASLYPSLEPFVFYSRDGRPRIDWTDFNATRELTRILLLHDHGLNWWIPDGQLCPTVPNRSNYIHWIQDLLSSDIVPKTHSKGIRGFDIGTGANCIYPLLGASLMGWRFVGSDVTEVAIEWAEKNVKSNPHISELIEIIRVRGSQCTVCISDQESPDGQLVYGGSRVDVGKASAEADCLATSSSWPTEDGETGYNGPPILLGVVREGEEFDFCMCNPPFFESIEEAGLNPKTSCGGTPEEMVCLGGEKAFITRIIKDSVSLQHSFRWFTSMVGRKVNLKFLISKLREVSATVLKTTEFVQGQTCRWGLAWSFVPPAKKIIQHNIVKKNNLSFTLEGLQRQFGAVNLLQSIDSFFRAYGAFCNLNSSAFTVDITLSADQCKAVLKDFVDGAASQNNKQDSSTNISFRISVFQQNPGTLLLQGSLQNKDSLISELFPSIFQALEEILRDEFFKGKARGQ